LEAETKIYASGKQTYFGVSDFSKNDLKNWRQWWYENRERYITK
jgi:diketogulonate reductase-like aldo/keto reductase